MGYDMHEACSTATPLGLYLHGGPGLSALVERRWFGDSVGMDWWDQPLADPGDPAPLASLSDAASARLLALVRRHGRPVPVVSHSIGAVLATRLTRDVPTLVSCAILVNPIFDLTSALSCLARRVAEAGLATDGLRRILADATLEAKGFTDFAAALSAIPARFDLYWAPSSTLAKERYLALAPAGPPFDPESFARIGTAIQDDSTSLHGIRTDVPVIAFVGASDPLVAGDASETVRRHLPDAGVRTVDAGHMAPFEQPAKIFGALTAGHPCAGPR